MANPTPIDTSRRGLQRLYYRLVLLGVAAVLALDLATGLVMASSSIVAPLAIGLYGVTLLFAGFAHAMVGDAPDREPAGVSLGITGILIVILCVETGGLASAYYMLVFATCVFGALVMKPSKAFLLTSMISAFYCILAWLYPSDGGLLAGGVAGVVRSLKSIAVVDPRQTSALVVHCAFLFIGTWIAMRLTVGFRATKSNLEDHAVRDVLTSLPNRRGFMEKLHQQSTRAVHWDWPIAILVIDLDHFKKVNDRFGHPVGDQVLAAAAQLLRESAGPLDNVGRIGGEEFAVAAVGADLSQAKDLADRIVRGFRNKDWEQVQPGLKCTCSIGVAVVQPSRTAKPVLDDLGALIDEADRALLQVKQHGRNGYLTASDGIARAESAPSSLGTA